MQQIIIKLHQVTVEMCWIHRKTLIIYFHLVNVFQLFPEHVPRQNVPEFRKIIFISSPATLIRPQYEWIRQIRLVRFSCSRGVLGGPITSDRSLLAAAFL